MASSSKESAVKVNLIGKRGPQDDLETKPFLKKHKGTSEDKEGGIRKKTLYFGNFALETKISDIINFFKNVEGVVRVQLVLSHETKHMGRGFVEFSSADEAKKALQNKNGEYFCDSKILLDVVSIGAADFPPEFCVDHKFWYNEDYLGQENLLIEEDETMEGLDEVSVPIVYKLCQEVTSGEETLFVSNLSPQTGLRDIVKFFIYFGGLVSVRLIVNHEGKHVGYGFLEFSSPGSAKRFLGDRKKKYLDDHRIFLAPATTIKDNLAEILWYEGRLPLEEVAAPPHFVEEVDVSNKTLFVGNFSPQTEISHIINFFKDVGEVVHVQLFVDCQGKHIGYGFVEFASTNESKKALDLKYGEYLHGRKIFLDLAKDDDPDPPRLKYLEYLRQESLPIEEDEIREVEYPVRPMSCIDHKVWYEDYLRQGSLLIEEDEDDETIEGLIEEVARRKKTLFVARLARRTEISDITSFFKDVAEVVRVRLIVDHMGDFVGCGFVEFASVYKAKKALHKKYRRVLRGRRVYLTVAKIAPYPLRPKYNRAEKLWSTIESYLMKKDDMNTKPKKKKKLKFCGKKTTFSDDDD